LVSKPIPAYRHLLLPTLLLVACVIAQLADLPECSTCHVYIPLSCPIPEPTDAELDMLGYALGFNEDESRLGCQVKVDEKVGEWCKAGGEFGLPRY
jgi:hypothetical protein